MSNDSCAMLEATNKILRSMCEVYEGHDGDTIESISAVMSALQGAMAHLLAQSLKDGAEREVMMLFAARVIEGVGKLREHEAKDAA